MFDRTKFVNDVLSTYEGNNPQVMVPEVLNALDVKINYAKSKKLRAIVDNRGRVVCKSKKGVSVERNTIGFKDLICNADDIDLSGGIFIITDNDDLVDQINYLIMQKHNK